MPKVMLDRWAWVASALWWGSLSTIGFLVVPLLFVHLGSPAVAGAMAAKLFQAQTWVSTVCGVVLLCVARSKEAEASAGASWGAIVFVVLGLLLALVSEFGVAPRIVARDNLKLWHAVGSAMYLAQWLCATWVLWRGTRSASA